MLALTISSLQTIAQNTSDVIPEKKTQNKLDLGLDLQSRYIWRGLQFGGNSTSAQPYIEFSSGKFAVGAWGAYSLGGENNFQEVDFYLSYSPIESLSFKLTDYFFPQEGIQNNYFEFGTQTGHVYEFMVSFSGTKKFPIGITVATNFAGADKDSDDKQSYTTYIEANYTTTIGDVEYNVFAGAVFADDNAYYLTDGSGFINLGFKASKEIKFTNTFSLPVNAALIFNPDQENIFLTFGFSL